MTLREQLSAQSSQKKEMNNFVLTPAALLGAWKKRRGKRHDKKSRREKRSVSNTT